MKNKKIIIFVSIILLIIASVCLYFFVFKNKDENKVVFEDNYNNEITIDDSITLNENGTPTYLDGKYTKVIVKDEKTAKEALKDLSSYYLIKDVNKEFSLESKNEINDLIYYRMQQYTGGVEVAGGLLVITTDKEGKVLNITGNYIPEIKPDNSVINVSKAENLLSEYYPEATIENVKKTIWDNNTIVYTATVYSEEFAYEIVMDGKEGKIIVENDLSEYFTDSTYEFTDKNNKKQKINVQLDDDQIKYRDNTRKITIVDATGKSQFGTILTLKLPYTAAINDHMSLADTAMKTYEDIYDFYKNNYNHKSYDNKGSDLNILINADYNNASWVNIFNYMSIGYEEVDGKKVSFIEAKDVLAHEYSHGVISQSAKLSNYCGKDNLSANESGALNEGIADIFGHIFDDKDWTMGEDVGKIIRDATDPNSLEYPKEKDGNYYFPTYNIKKNGYKNVEEYYDYIQKKYPEDFSKYNKSLCVSNTDNGGAHKNSNVVSHAGYLLYKTGVFKTKIEMGKVWYNALFKMTSHSTFKEASYAFLAAARDLGYKEEDVKKLKEVFVKTRMLDEAENVKGTVTDKSGNKLSGVTVVLTNKLNPKYSFRATTKEDGTYAFYGLQAGEYYASYEKSKFETLEKEVEIFKNTDNLDAKLNKLENESDDDISDVVFVLDISASMDDNDPKDIRKQILVNILSTMNKKDRAAVVTFTAISKVLNDGLNQSEISKKIIMTDIFNIANNNGSTADAGTDGRAGLTEALKLFDSKNNNKKYIIFFTDGEDTKSSASDLTYEEIIKKAKEMNIRILTIGLSKNVKSDNLIKLAKETNGKYYIATEDTDLSEFDRKIYEEIE